MNKSHQICACKALVVLFSIVCLVIALVLGIEVGFKIAKKHEFRHAMQFANNCTYWKFHKIMSLDVLNNPSKAVWETSKDRYRPGKSYTLDYEGESVCITINKHGFRAPEFEIQKSKDVTRIICIGGSTTVGGLTNHSTYPWLLQDILNKKHGPGKFEVLNFGIGGTCSDYWIHNIDELFSYNPDLIIQYNAVNDICWKYIPLLKSRNYADYQMRKSYLYSYIVPIDKSNYSHLIMESVSNFVYLYNEAKERNVRYVMCTFAAPEYDLSSGDFKHFLDHNTQFFWGQGYFKYYYQYKTILDEFNACIRQAGKNFNIEVIDISKNLSDSSLFVDICHRTKEGRKRHASLVADYLSANPHYSSRDLPEYQQ